MKHGMRVRMIYKLVALSLVFLVSEGLFPDSNELCSVATISYGGEALLFGNVDFSSWELTGASFYIYFYPASEDGYGYVALGSIRKENGRDRVTFFGRMNEKGLAYSGNGVPDVPLNSHPEKPFSIYSDDFLLMTMRECSDVDCVIKMANNFDWGNSSSELDQLHFADSTGDAVVISAGKDGELAFTRKEKRDGYLVSTNFNRANPENGRYPCWRYNTAVEMLERIESENDLTIDYLTSILDATHVEGMTVNTAVSYVFDLQNRDIYVYYFHQYDEVAVLNLPDEMAGVLEGAICKGKPFTNLFSLETTEMAKTEFEGYQRRFFAIIVLGAVLGIAGFSIICQYIYKRKRNKCSLIQEEMSTQDAREKEEQK